jgi:ATP-binding cassette subfamily B protein
MKKQQNALRWLNAAAGRDKAYIAALALSQALLGGSGVLFAVLLRGLIDAAVAGDVPALRRSAVQLVLLVLGQLALRALNRFLREYCAAGLENRFKKRLFGCLLRKDYAAVTAVHSGEWMNRLTNDTAVVAKSATSILPNLAGLLVRLVGATSALVYLESRFAAVLLPGGLLVMLLTYAFRRVLKALHKRIQEADGRLRIFLQERIGSLMMIRSFAAEPQTAADAEEKMQQHKAARMRKIRFSNFCNIGFQSGMEGMYLFVACWCAWGIYQGTVSFGTLTAMTQLIAQIQSPFANITGYLPRFYAMTASAERLAEIENYAEDLTESPKTAAEVQAYYREDFAALRLSDVSFTYLPASESDAEKGRICCIHGTFRLRQIDRAEAAFGRIPSGCGQMSARQSERRGNPGRQRMAPALCVCPAGQPAHERHNPRDRLLCRSVGCTG